MAGGINATVGEITDLTSAIGVPTGSGMDPLPGKRVGAAQDFEALLIGQMLHSMREQGSGWLGTGDDDAGATAFSFGEDELARALARSGGLGLSKIIAAGLETKSAAAENPGKG